MNSFLFVINSWSLQQLHKHPARIRESFGSPTPLNTDSRLFVSFTRSVENGKSKGYICLALDERKRNSDSKELYNKRASIPVWIISERRIRRWEHAKCTYNISDAFNTAIAGSHGKISKRGQEDIITRNRGEIMTSSGNNFLFLRSSHKGFWNTPAIYSVSTGGSFSGHKATEYFNYTMYSHGGHAVA
jgi:hypothetical protein